MYSMANVQLWALLREKFGTLVISGLLVGALAFFALMMTEKPFQTRMDFLVVQTSAQNQDYYSLFKSSEYLGKVLSEAIYSERFINAMVETGKVNAEFLPFDKKQKLATWQKTVTVEKNLELGIISVTVKGERERDVARIMDALAQVLTEKNMLFRGGDEKSVEIRVLSGPILEQNPTPTKIVEVAGAGFIAGFLVMLFLQVLKAEGARRESEYAEAELSLNDAIV